MIVFLFELNEQGTKHFCFCNFSSRNRHVDGRGSTDKWFEGIPSKRNTKRNVNGT